MKNAVICIMLLMALASCSKNDTPTVNIANSTFYLKTTDSGGGEVWLKVDGSTNADRVTIETYGDGLITEYEAKLGSEGNFNEDIQLSFTMNSVPSEAFVARTEIRAYKADETATITLKSGSLHY